MFESMKIPIVFSFNDHYTIPAGVCIHSLLSNAGLNTFYEIYILHSGQRLCKENRHKINQLTEQFDNCTISYIELNDNFKNEYEVRNVSIETYYRLLIPNLIKKYDKVIYCDCDICFNGDLSDLYNISLNDKYIAAVANFHKTNISKKFKKYAKKIDVNPLQYFNAGVILLNSKKIFDNQVINNCILPLLGKKFKYQDQDILNIVFKDQSILISPEFNFTLYQNYDITQKWIPKVYHYLLQKPWNYPVAFGNIWWQNYKNSIFYNAQYYHESQIQQHSKINRDRVLGQLFELIPFVKNKK